MTARTLAAAAVVTLVIAGCGESVVSDPHPAGGSRTQGTTTEELCVAYRTAVANVRFFAGDADEARDFRAVAAAARAAAGSADRADLAHGSGTQYAEKLTAIARAYADAAAALEDGDDRAFARALEIAGPADDEIDGLARRGGLSECPLGAPQRGERAVRESGFPAIVLPRGLRPLIPFDREVSRRIGAASYGFDDGETLSVNAVGGEPLDRGTVPLAEAAETFEREFEREFGHPLEPLGDSGNRLVPMRAYRYDGGELRGTAEIHVFSGQGRVWTLWCNAQGQPELTPRLEHACERAVQTLGFLMFRSAPE